MDAKDQDPRGKDPRDQDATDPEPTDRAPGGSKAGEQVGLGRVVRDDATAPGLRPAVNDVEEALSGTFPASDPPPFSGGRATADPGRTEPELPDPRDVP